LAEGEFLARDRELAIRLMRDEVDDYQRMLAWLSDPRVLEFTYGRDRVFSLDEIRGKYGSRIRGESPSVPCFIVHEGRDIGYIQFYRWVDWIEGARKMGLDPDDSAYGIDLWIGEADLWDQGLGTRAVRAILRHLSEQRGATSVALTTVTWNARAIRCYEKAGFRKVRRLPESELREGKWHDEWVMSAQPAGLG
jgi:aminoglycoside 6'-N-acetyltransferase